MIHKDIIAYLKNYFNDLGIANKLIVGAFIEFNCINVNHNKLIKACIEGNDNNKIKEFVDLIKKNIGKYDFEDLTELFEITIPTKDVITNGAVYTPYYIKNYIVENAIKTQNKLTIDDIKIADIACGTGAFLQTAIEQLKSITHKTYFELFQNNIFGLDISDYTIHRAKLLLSLLAIMNGEDRSEFEFNLFIGNALDFQWNQALDGFTGFDIVVGNPPYVRAKHLSHNSKELMSNWDVTKSGNPDLYIPFFEIGLFNLKETGILSFITVNTFKRSVNARGLRDYFKVHRLSLSIIDFGNQQIFENKSTYTCIVNISKNKVDTVKHVKATPEDVKTKNLASFSEVEYRLLDTNKGWVLNRNNVLENIKKLESAGEALGNKYIIKNGIATLCNDIFIFKPVDEDEKYYYHQNGKLHKIEKAICRDIIKPNRLKTEEEIPKLKEKIIFPYQIDNRQFNLFQTNNSKYSVLDEQYFQDIYPNAYTYLKYNQEQLLNRDKGKSLKYKWFEFGRSQAINDYGKKLLFPYMSSQPYFVYTDQVDLLIYAGYAIFCDSERELKIVKRILESEVFWYYITKTSKPYSGNFYALAKNYVKDFSICDLTIDEEDFLLTSVSKIERDNFLNEKYRISNLL